MSENRVLPAASGEVYYRDPDTDPPPMGVKLLVLTSGGVAIISDWRQDTNFVQWSPLPRKRLPALLRSPPVQHIEDPDHA